MKTDAQFENFSYSDMKFRAGIETNNEKNLEATPDEESAPQKGSNMWKNENCRKI